jgi:TPR repeat protein
MSRNEEHMQKHLIEAAERGDAEVQFNLAVMYENELFDSRYVAEGSHSEATRWLLAAAEQGLARAQVKLAEMYDRDIDMPDGSIKACEWYLLAAQGLRGAQLQRAQSAYQRAAKGLTTAQAAEVMRFVQGWRAKITPNTISGHAAEGGR